MRLQIFVHLGKDAEVNTINGQRVTNFSAADSFVYKDKQGVKQTNTTWIDCALWSDDSLTPCLKKDTYIYAEGTPSVHGWKDKQGEAHASIRLRITHLRLLSPKPETNKPGEKEPDENVAFTEQGNEDNNNIDDLPF